MSKSHSNGNGSGVPAASYIRMSSDKQDASLQQQRTKWRRWRHAAVICSAAQTTPKPPSPNGSRNL